jgi:hypothetical protein
MGNEITKNMMSDHLLVMHWLHVCVTHHASMQVGLRLPIPSYLITCISFRFYQPHSADPEKKKVYNGGKGRI